MSEKNHIIVGKVYANWCGHCKDLKPIWEELKSSLEKKMESLDLKIDFVEIEESEKKKLEEYPGLKVNGYPTIFKIKNNGKIEYYDGHRELAKMQDWVLGNEKKDSMVGGKSKKSKKSKSSKKSKTKKRTTKKQKKSKSTISRLTSLFSFRK